VVKARGGFAESKSMIAEFSTDRWANALIMRSARSGREPAIGAAWLFPPWRPPYLQRPGSLWLRCWISQRRMAAKRARSRTFSTR